MKTIIKDLKNSDIVKEDLKHPKDKTRILEILFSEQTGFCAYTEDRMSATHAKDVEHFNPTLKGTPNDGYQNWFMTNHLWNQRKGTKNAISRWNEHQPIIELTNSSISKKLGYKDGNYFIKKANDEKLENLLNYLLINELGLPKERREYIKSLRNLNFSVSALEEYLKRNPIQIRFPTALFHEFGIDVWKLLSSIQ
jgi:hypothetical protein